MQRCSVGYFALGAHIPYLWDAGSGLGPSYLAVKNDAPRRKKRECEGTHRQHGRRQLIVNLAARQAKRTRVPLCPLRSPSRPGRVADADSGPRNAQAGERLMGSARSRDVETRRCLSSRLATPAARAVHSLLAAPTRAQQAQASGAACSRAAGLSARRAGSVK